MRTLYAITKAKAAMRSLFRVSRDLTGDFPPWATTAEGRTSLNCAPSGWKRRRWDGEAWQ
jgi:hypothetical protein